MSNRTLGIFGLIGAPFLFIDTMNNNFSVNQTNDYSGFYNLLYITGWMSSMIALNRMGAFGRSKFGKFIFLVQMLFLTLANGWNIYECIQPQAGTALYFFLDAFWPISNVFMLITGITIVYLGGLPGWRRYVPLAVGSWLPLGILLWTLFTRTPSVLLTLNIYSMLAWLLMAFSIVTFPAETPGNNHPAIVNRRKPTAA